MKKIVLTLGIFLSAYATYAIGNSNQANIEDDSSCERIVRVFEDGVIVWVYYEPC
ncbi:hypothetical protein [Aquimarina megaterium]|uniref:hypothetical protein n=1 Tax=Aquimarina megaterium TaxID=1443666 RepID=UPI000A4C8B65|nr:hypothetical protein [Aquimarina megaterium]